MTITDLQEEVLRLASRLTREGQIDQLERCVGIVKELNAINQELQEVKSQTPDFNDLDEIDQTRTRSTKSPNDVASPLDEVIGMLRKLPPNQRFDHDDWTEFIDLEWVTITDATKFTGEGKDKIYEWKNEGQIVWRSKPHSKRQIFQFCPKSIALKLANVADPRLQTAGIHIPE